jgi:hypothetical protein
MDVCGIVGMVRYQCHALCLQWMHFVVISPNRIKNRLRNKNMTGQLQPLDVSVNKPFKQLVCEHYSGWLNKEVRMTPNGKMIISINNWNGFEKLGNKC